MNVKMEEARLLLEYAINAKLELEEGVQDTIIQASHETNWDVAKEIKFIEAVESLTRSCGNVTLETLKASKKEYGKPLISLFKWKSGIVVSDAGRAVWQYWTWAILVLLIIIGAQSYWYVSHTLISRFQDLSPQVAENVQGVFALQNDLEVLIATDTNGSNTLDILAKTEELEEKLADTRFIYQEALAVHHLLKKWYDRWTIVYAIVGVQVDMADPPELPADTGPEEFDLGSHAMNKARTSLSEAEKLIKRVKIPHRVEEVSMYMNAVSFPQEILVNYLFPLLYGLMGAIAFVLRSLSDRVRTVTYSRKLNTGYSLRLQLGMLAGLAIGWFFKADGASGVASLSPLALSFVGGYSVELFFFGLDRVINTFTDPLCNDCASISAMVSLSLEASLNTVVTRVNFFNAIDLNPGQIYGFYAPVDIYP